MTGVELIERLWESGTGAGTLELARPVLDANKKADGPAVRAALESGGAAPATLKKADALLAGETLRHGPRATHSSDLDWPLLARIAERTNARAPAAATDLPEEPPAKTKPEKP